jgi:uncharacterized integral membrane protein
MAGRKGKCPKCGTEIRIPGEKVASASSKASANRGASSQAATKSSRSSSVSAPQPKSPSKPAQASKQPKAAASQDGLDDFFTDAGIGQQSGPVCPKCFAPITRGSAICISCGVNLQSGEQLTAYQSTNERAEFKNLHLEEASNAMRAEAAADRQSMNSGTPWWVILCILLVGIMLAVTGVVVVDVVVGNGKAPEGTFIGNLQRMPLPVVLIGIVTIGASLITFFAHGALVVSGFRESKKQGAMTLLIPLYSGLFGLMRFEKVKGIVISFWIALTIAVGTGVYLAANFSL